MLAIDTAPAGAAGLVAKPQAMASLPCPACTPTPYNQSPRQSLRLLTACAGGAAPRPPPVPAASSDRVAERALRCLMALLHGTYAAPPWDAPPPEPGDGAGQREREHAADTGRESGHAAALVPAPGVLVDLLQRLAALAEVGRERSAEEVFICFCCMCTDYSVAHSSLLDIVHRYSLRDATCSTVTGRVFCLCTRLCQQLVSVLHTSFGGRQRPWPESKGVAAVISALLGRLCVPQLSAKQTCARCRCSTAACAAWRRCWWLRAARRARAACAMRPTRRCWPS